MKKINLWLTLSAVAILASGCAQTSPEPSSSNISDASHIEGDTITMDESNSIESWGEEGYISQDGQVLGNTSRDGFQSAYFGFDKYNVSPEMYTIVQKNVQNANKTAAKIKIEGNCDSFGTAEYNHALGLKRANAIKKAMINEGVDPSRMIIVSMGESNPACQETVSESCMNKNRRADIAFIK